MLDEILLDVLLESHELSRPVYEPPLPIHYILSLLIQNLHRLYLPASLALTITVDSR